MQLSNIQNHIKIKFILQRSHKVLIIVYWIMLTMSLLFANNAFGLPSVSKNHSRLKFKYMKPRQRIAYLNQNNNNYFCDLNKSHFIFVEKDKSKVKSILDARNKVFNLTLIQSSYSRVNFLVRPNAIGVKFVFGR
jgi:hypothetical protein